MAWWGKLVGGTLGFLIGGPLGALLGAVLGHNLDVGLKVIRDKQIGHDDIDFAPGDQERVQMAFFTATFSVMGALAKADGLITRDEIALAESVMRQMNLPADMRQTAMRLFNEGKQSGFPLQGVILQFRQECHRRANLMRIFMEIQVQAAYADGQLHAKEEKLLIEICDWLGFHEAVFRQIEALVKFSLGISGKSRQHHQGYQQYSAEQDSQLTRAEAYELLGVTPSSSRDEIKKAYRRLMSQHHPDKLVAKGLPEEMMKLATEKSQKIREAYDLITGSH
jgi:DnaJ like chaperone protein